MSKIIEFYVSVSWDAQTHRVFVHPPADWDDMPPDERERFLQEEAEQWAYQDVEIGGIAYDDPSEIDNSRWGDSYDEDSVEDFFGDGAPESERTPLSDTENVRLEVVEDES